jgi:hypothetical protein
MLHVIIGLLCAVASIILMGVVAWMNYRFTSRLGTTELDGQIFGTGSVAVDVMLAMLSALIVWGVKEQRILYAFSAVGMVVCFAVLSFVSALGFAAEGRDGAAAKRETGRLAVKAAEQNLEDLRARKMRLGTPRSVSIVEAELEGLRADPRWTATKQCTTAMTKTLRQWCQAAQKVNVESAAASEAERLQPNIETATAELLAARQTQNPGFVDAQLEVFTEATGWAEAKVRFGLLFLVAFVMQLGAVFGIAMGLAPLQHYVEQKKHDRLKKPVPEGHIVWREAGVDGTSAKEPVRRSADGREAASHSKDRLKRRDSRRIN